MSLLSRFEKNISERGESLRVGLVGAGQMGQGIVAQLNKTKGVDLQLIVDKNQDKLEKALEKYTSQDKKTVLSQTIQSIDDLELDVVIEATGTPSSGADVAKKVLNRGIHLILLNVETEGNYWFGIERRSREEQLYCHSRGWRRTSCCR
jgi:predicted homoserine dehydrogenase-like protein